MAEYSSDTVARIAERGRETLVLRLREAFAEAASGHADVLRLDAEGLEKMVQQAAARADGLQWRRALAAAATEELGIGLGEALGHPAVAEAQQLIGAPSYEDGLAAISAGRAPASGGTDEAAADRDAAVERSARGGRNAHPAADVDEPAATDRDAGASDTDGADIADRLQSGSAETIDVRVRARHVEGLAALGNVTEVTLSFSDNGLELTQGGGPKRLEAYGWDSLHGVHVRAERRGMLRRRPVQTKVIVAIGGEAAKFEVDDADPDQLEQQLAPVRARLAGGG